MLIVFVLACFCTLHLNDNINCELYYEDNEIVGVHIFQTEPEQSKNPALIAPLAISLPEEISSFLGGEARSGFRHAELATERYRSVSQLLRKIPSESIPLKWVCISDTKLTAAAAEDLVLLLDNLKNRPQLAFYESVLDHNALQTLTNKRLVIHLLVCTSAD